MPVFALTKASELLVESVLGLQGNGNDLPKLSLTPAREDELSACSVMVVPGGSNQEAADMDVAASGEGTPLVLAPRAVL